MIHKVKIQLIGEALGAVLPQDLLDNMNIGKDDELLAVPSDEGILYFEKGIEAF